MTASFSKKFAVLAGAVLSLALGSTASESKEIESGGAPKTIRNRQSIQRVVQQNMAALNHAYNRRLREKPTLAGKIDVKFTIDEFGRVTDALVVETTMNDKELENTVTARVKSWQFGKVNNPGDIAEVTYPLVFGNAPNTGSAPKAANAPQTASTPNTTGTPNTANAPNSDGSLTGGRNRPSIQRVVMQNMAALRHAYNRRLREKPDLAGKIYVKFAIDEFGSVTTTEVVNTTMNDKELEDIIAARVKSWQFGKINKPGDVTEVVYPFVFDNGPNTGSAQKNTAAPNTASTPNTVAGSLTSEGRSRASINKIVTQNMAALRHAYNRRLREKPSLAGNINVKFCIDEFGKVITAEVVNTTINDKELEDIVTARVKTWNFEKINKPGDVTEVVYPFVFSQ